MPLCISKGKDVPQHAPAVELGACSEIFHNSLMEGGSQHHARIPTVAFQVTALNSRLLEDLGSQKTQGLSDALNSGGMA